MITTKERKNSTKKIPVFLIFSIFILYMELMLRIVTCEDFWNRNLFFVVLFSLISGMFFDGIYCFFNGKARKLAGNIIAVCLFVLYAVQITYHLFFGKYLIIYSIVSGGVDQVLSGHIVSNAIAAIVKGIPYILLLMLAPIGYFILSYKMEREDSNIRKGTFITVGSLLLYMLLTVIIGCLPGYKTMQSGIFDPNTSVGAFGLIHTEVLDIKYNLLGFSQNMSLTEGNVEDVLTHDEEKETSTEETLENMADYSPHVSDVDFNALANSESNKELKLLNQYFAEREPTNRNDFTGMYEGYNLIHIVAEGFSPYAISEKLTPTLYKMQQEGFQFRNFYTPIWGVSTSDGEYVACTGLLPKPGVWSFYQSRDNYMPYCLGNMFQSIGVNETYAYHNNSYTYYHRNDSHPNMGYDFKGMGNGVENYVKNVWPQSDYEMIAGSMSDYLSADKQFHAYYMTVSGHLEYTKYDNMMAYQNWDAVKHLDCSETLKAYYACNIELDKAMEKMLIKLNEAGVADKTVISITPDHYPYGLEKSGSNKYKIWKELLGHEVDTEFELYESCFLLYCQGTKNPPVVEKYCYSADIIPTLLNLFGFEYDSRLLIGRDIMSDTEGLVVMADGSYITDYGRYSYKKGKFMAFDDATFASEEQKEEYAKIMKGKVANMLQVSTKILETDYYRYVFR